MTEALWIVGVVGYFLIGLLFVEDLDIATVNRVLDIGRDESSEQVAT